MWRFQRPLQVPVLSTNIRLTYNVRKLADCCGPYRLLLWALVFFPWSIQYIIFNKNNFWFPLACLSLTQHSGRAHDEEKSPSKCRRSELAAICDSCVTVSHGRTCSPHLLCDQLHFHLNLHAASDLGKVYTGVVLLKGQSIPSTWVSIIHVSSEEKNHTFFCCSIHVPHSREHVHTHTHMLAHSYLNLVLGQEIIISFNY